MNTLRHIAFLFVLALAGCEPREVRIDFPTPPPPPAPTPLAKLELKPDAELELQIAKIAEEAKGKVGVAAVVLETGESAMLNGDERFPMQSVYKLPIAMAVMDQVRRGELDLDAVIGVRKEDMVRQGQHSPLRDQNPNGGEFTIRELMRLALVESDGTASDVLMNTVGGAVNIQAFLTQIGVRDMRVANTEKEIGQDWETQYQNWSTPVAAMELLRWLDAGTGAALGLEPAEDRQNENEMLIQFMHDSNPGTKRIKGLLPKDVTAHKTGTGGTRDGITSATNDIGIVYLQDRKLAIAIFISDSSADETTRESVMAKIAKAVWDKWKK